jgi:catechol 2,3-dioxygenase-like lactoylglutathione lyase family enzyme
VRAREILDGLIDGVGGSFAGAVSFSMDDSMAKARIALTARLVREYDEAIRYFTERLGFVLLEDTPLTEMKRWVRVAPNEAGPSLLLARADKPEQTAQIGKQAGGRVALFLETDDFARDYRAMCDRGVTFETEPRRESYGTYAVFRDLYGNRWDLIEPAG